MIGRRVFKCPHCPFWASTASRFHVHIVGHLNRKPFECSLCAYRSNWRWDITKHIKLKAARDPAHLTARVLMTDETGRRNYSKYNKYLAQVRKALVIKLLRFVRYNFFSFFFFIHFISFFRCSHLVTLMFVNHVILGRLCVCVFFF